MPEAGLSFDENDKTATLSMTDAPISADAAEMAATVQSNDSENRGKGLDVK